MLLINKVKINELNTYREEYLDCLKHNISNSIITKIIIWVDDPDHNIPKLSNKVDVFFKKDQSIFNAIEVSKKLTPEEVIIFSTTLFKFNHDLFKIRPEVVGQTVLTDGGNYFIFARNCQLSDVGQINGIFPLTRKKINLHTENQSVVKISHKSSGEAKAEIKPIIKAKSEQKVNFTAVRKKVLEKVGEFNSQKIIKRKGVIPQVEVKRRSKKLDVIIVSVNYNDLLIVSLSHNVKIFENITVVTSPDDLLCQKICQKFGVNCLVTSVMYEGGAPFNKGKAINEGIKSLDNPDFILLIDADIVLESKIDIDSLNEDVLYTSSRLICKSYQIYKTWKDENLDIEKVGRLENNKGIGFFQLFNISNSNVDRENPYPENSQNASWSDLIFRDKFPKKSDWGGKTIHLGDPYINWDGRVTRRFLTDEEFLEILQKRSTFTICSFYFNYNGDLRQKSNFVKFLQQWKDYYDNMIVGIVDYGDIDFEIPCEKVIIEGDVNKRIWSKEILINKIVEKIDTDYIIWIDGDIIYEDLSWLNNLDGVIGDNDFVQLFETINYLGENAEVLESHKSLVSGKGDVDKLLGAGYKPGGSWMTRTKLLKSNPLFEKMLVGGGDTILAYALFGIEEGWTLGKVKEGSNEVYEVAKKWIADFGKKKVGYLPIGINHLYHGDLKDRNYNERYRNLKEIGPKIIVFTENIGNYDELKPIKKFDNTRCIAFMDKDLKIDGWEVINIDRYQHIVALKNTKLICKYIRTHSSELLPEHDFSLHIDANMILNEDPNVIIKEIITSGSDVMSFNHYKRKSIYQEAEQCIKWQLDNENKILQQIERYRNHGLTNGLYECGFMLRKNNKKVHNFDKLWWREILNFSQRDQISFPYAIDVSNVNFSTFNIDNRMKSHYISIKTDKTGKTHKGDRLYNNNLCFVFEDNRINWGSTKMRGKDISEILKCEMVPLSKSESIKYKKIIILKLSNYKKIIRLSESNEVIIDMVDFNSEIHDLSIFKYFDYGIFTSQTQLKKFYHIFKYPEKCKVILHHWDKRFENIKIKENNFPKICYIGQQEKCFNYSKNKNIDYFSIDWYDFDEKIKIYENYNVHFGVKPQEEENKIQPSTKISTAACIGSPILVNKSKQNLELLGEDYPYFCNADENEIEIMIDKVKKTFKKSEWKIALNKLAAIKEATKLENIAKKYLEI